MAIPSSWAVAANGSRLRRTSSRLSVLPSMHEVIGSMTKSFTSCSRSVSRKVAVSSGSCRPVLTVLPSLVSSTVRNKTRFMSAPAACRRAFCIPMSSSMAANATVTGWCCQSPVSLPSVALAAMSMLSVLFDTPARPAISVSTFVGTSGLCRNTGRSTFTSQARVSAILRPSCCARACFSTLSHRASAMACCCGFAATSTPICVLSVLLRVVRVVCR